VRREKRYYVYVLASKSRVLYVGVTGFLLARVLQHKSGECEGLTARYKVNRMVHFEVFQYVNNDRTGNGDQEVAAETKVALLEANNPSREDLAAHGGKSALMARADSSAAEAGSESDKVRLPLLCSAWRVLGFCLGKASAPPPDGRC
jgi:putative endonuclease